MKAAYLAILLLSTVLAATGQVLLKLGSHGQTRVQDFLNLANAGGMALYFASAALWMVALSRLPLQVVYPFTILTLLFVGLASVVVFGERPNAFTITGWGLSLLGVGIIAAGLTR